MAFEDLEKKFEEKDKDVAEIEEECDGSRPSTGFRRSTFIRSGRNSIF